MTTELQRSWDSGALTPDQEKRHAAARTGECTPLEIDTENSIGYFSGRSGRYTTTLQECTCMDFARRHKPCKHMYRLAMELGLLDDTVEKNKAKIKAPYPEDSYVYEQIIHLLDSCSQSAQKVYKEYLYFYLYQKSKNFGFKKSDDVAQLIDKDLLIHSDSESALLGTYARNELNALVVPLLDGIPFKKNMTKLKLIEWIINTIPDKIPVICKDAVAVTVHPLAEKERHKVYSYLHQKYDYEEW